MTTGEAMAAPVERTVSGVSGGTPGAGTGTGCGGTPRGAAVVSHSLEGLVSAVDELKRSMGLGGGEAEAEVDFAAVEEFVQRLRQENEEFRQFAEEAILSAQRLRAERDDLQARLDDVSLEATMGAALKETQKLKDVADEFERDLYQQKLEEAEARLTEIEALKERIGELEEENAGLTQTLNEFRQTTQQLQKLQSHEMRRLQAVEKTGGGRADGAALAVAAAVAADAQQQQNGDGSGPGAAPSAGSSPTAASSVSLASPASSFRVPRSSPRASASGASVSVGDGVAAAGGSPAAPMSQQAEQASKIAEQLEEVAGGADTGLLAEAALALRELTKRDAELVAAQKENTRLRSEVDELNDTMFSKTFKPPSAWAEREIKYKSEKKFWEEQQKELGARVVVLTAEMEAYRGTSKAHELERRIQDLEARLLQSEREKDNARSQLHELQLSLRTEGEFGSGGKRLSPYKGPLGVSSEGHEVQQLVDFMEQGSLATSPEVTGVAATTQRVRVLEAQLHTAIAENQTLRKQLLGQAMVPVPASLQSELGKVATLEAVQTAAADIAGRLQRAEAASEAVREELGGDAAAAAVVQAEVAAAEQQAEAMTERAEKAAAEGQAGDAARLKDRAGQLQRVAAQLRATEQERLVLAGALRPLRELAASTASTRVSSSGVAGEESQAVVEVPPAVQQELGLGPTAPASVVKAEAADLELRLSNVQAESVELRQQLRAAVALEQAAARAEDVEQAAEAVLTAGEQAAAGDAAGLGASASAATAGAASQEEVEQLRRELEAAQRQKGLAQQQLWQLQELQEQLQASSAERRRLASEISSARPVSLNLSVLAGAEGAAAGGQQAQQQPAAQQAEQADVVQMRAQLAEAQRRSSELLTQLESMRPVAAAGAAAAPAGAAAAAAAGEAAEQPVVLPLRLGGEDAEAASRLLQAEAEVVRLRQQLADLQPVKLQLSLASPSASPPSSGATARRSLDPAVSGLAAAGLAAAALSPTDIPLMPDQPSPDGTKIALLYSSEYGSALTEERRAAESALLEYQKNTDVPSLLRTKAELETRCQMLEAQVAKMQADLAHADEANAVFENHLDSALKTGDVSVLSGLKDKVSAGRQSLSKRMFKRGGKGANTVSPSKDALKTTVHEMQEALASSEEERNALKRQLAKLSKKYQQVTQQAAHTAGIVAGAAAMQGQGQGRTSTESVEASPEASVINGGVDEDGELELMKLREENEMLMEHVVMVKVRQAEMEGDYLEAKRQLLRAREKNLQLARKVQSMKEAHERGEPLPLTPTGSGIPDTSTATSSGMAAASSSLTPLGAALQAQQAAAASAAASAGDAGATPRSEARKSRLRIL